MNKEDILRMAREAGLLPCQGIHPGDLERFFRLAYEAGAAAEREACAQVGMLVAKNGIETSAAIRARRKT